MLIHTILKNVFIQAGRTLEMVNRSKKNPNIFSTNLKILFLEVGNFLETKVGNFSGSAIRWFPREKIVVMQNNFYIYKK